MPMPQTYSPCPRPILKRSSATAPNYNDYSRDHSSIVRDESGALLNIDPSILSPLVRFPPSPTLTRTFTAYSPSAYDRSPIVVSPNRCSLPERGCPGRTYMPTQTSSQSSSYVNGYKTAMSSTPLNGKCLHPRARDISPYEDDDLEDDDLTPKATPTAYYRPLPQPALIPDVSSSESEESDGFIAPQSSLLDFSSLRISQSSPATSKHSPRMRSYPPSSPSSTTSTPSPPRPIRTSTSPTRSRPSTSTSPSRSPSSSNRTTSPTRKRRSHRHSSSSPSKGDTTDSEADVIVSPLEPRYKTFSDKSMLTSCALEVPDMGCFGGF